MSIKMGAVKMGGAVVDNKMSVGGGIKIGGGGSAPVVEAIWGQIQGDIGNQTDLMDALALKADATDLADYATESELSAVSAAVSTKLTTPSGTNGQFLSLVDGVWTAVNLPVYEGGVN